MEIVDVHMHLWRPETHEWVAKMKGGGHPSGSFRFIQNYLPEDYICDTQLHNVTQCVHVEANWSGDPLKETQWLNDLRKTNKRGFPQAIVAYCDLSSKSADEVLTRHREVEQVVGVRQMVNYSPVRFDLCVLPDDTILTSREWIEGVGLLERHTLSFEVHALPHQHQRVYDVVKKYPNIQFILDHCGLPFIRDEENMTLWKNGLAKLASCPNVVAKISGLFMMDPNWTTSSVLPIAQQVLKTFGINRCMFASNFPVDKVNVTFDQLMSVHYQLTEDYTDKERELYFGGLAKEIYKLK